MVKIAVVGATGPTGIHLVTELRKTVAPVRVIARSMDKLVRLFPEAAVEKWEADIRDADATLRAIEGCDLVYDCIGLPGNQMHSASGGVMHDAIKTTSHRSSESRTNVDTKDSGVWLLEITDCVPILVAQSITLSKARFYGVSGDVYWLEGRSQELT